MRAKFVLTEAATGLWRNVTMTVAMILTTAISLALLGAGGLLYKQVGEMRDLLYARVEVSIFLEKGITATQREALEARLGSDPQIKTFQFETKQKAYENFKELFKDSPDLVSNVKPDSLPESFRIKLQDPTKSAQVDQIYRNFDGVDDVSTQEELVAKLFDALDAVKYTVFAISLTQGIAALLLIANTIQVAAYSRRREVSIMKLVGASNWYVRLPFVLEAAVAGLIGATIAWISLLVTKWTLIDHVLQPIFTGLVPELSLGDVLITGPILGLIAVVLAAATGWSTLRLYVKV